MRASDVLKGTVYEILAGDIDCQITDLADDSRDITQGTLLCAGEVREQMDIAI